MRKICAWCGKELEPPAGALASDARVSHGVCAECFGFLIRNDRRSLSSFLDRLPVPVLLLNEQRSVILANERARTVFPVAGAAGGTPVAVGNMIECAHARLPQGCGGTVYCAACQVRRSVNLTFESGRPQTDVEAVRDVETGAGEVHQRIRFSTEKLGESVLLRLESPGFQRVDRPGA